MKKQVSLAAALFALLLTATFFALLLAASCARSQTGRYQVIPDVPLGLSKEVVAPLRIDTATGKTWLMGGRGDGWAWKPVYEFTKSEAIESQSSKKAESSGYPALSPSEAEQYKAFMNDPRWGGVKQAMSPDEAAQYNAFVNDPAWDDQGRSVLSGDASRFLALKNDPAWGAAAPGAINKAHGTRGEAKGAGHGPAHERR